MAEWKRRSDRTERNYADVEFANDPNARRDYERRYGSEEDYRRLTDINREEFPRRRRGYRVEPEYQQMYDAATRDYTGYGDEGLYGRYRAEPEYEQIYDVDDRARDRDVGRFTDRSAYNPHSRDLSPDEFRRGREDYWAAYGARGAQSRPADYYRNRSELYDGRPEARGWRPDEETSAFAPHRGRGPKDYKRSDERIREDVNDRLTEDHFLDASGISVSVKDGEVTLSGSVETKRGKRRAEDIADSVSGVSHVQNNLRATGNMPPSGRVSPGEGVRVTHESDWGAASPGSGTTAQRPLGNGNFE